MINLLIGKTGTRLNSLKHSKTLIQIDVPNQRQNTSNDKNIEFRFSVSVPVSMTSRVPTLSQF